MSWINQIKAEFSHIAITDRKIREFLGVFLFITVGVAFWWLHKHHWELGPEVLFAALLIAPVFAVGFVFPMLYQSSYKAWMGLAIVLGFFVSSLIIGIVYYLVMTPIGLYKRVTTSDFLNVRKDASRASYWENRSEKFTKKSFEKLY